MPSISSTATEVSAAMVAAVAFPLVLNWTDYVKTRMQTLPASGSTALPFDGGFAETASRIMKEEGVVRLWGTGMPAAVMREVLVVGTRVGAYPAVRDAIAQFESFSMVEGPDLRQAGHGQRGDTGLKSKLAAGLLLGAVSGVLAGPCDLVRIRIQAEAGLVDSSGVLTTGLHAGLPRRLKHTPHAFAAVWSESGVRAGLLRGAGANIVHSCCITVGTVPVYEHTKHLAKTKLGWVDGLRLHAFGGIVAGLVGTTVVRLRLSPITSIHMSLSKRHAHPLITRAPRQEMQAQNS